MKRFRTQGILLRRVNFGEHDRIVTFLTIDAGKVSAIARGVRKPKSKLAGGMELFSLSELSFIETRGNLDQLISTRLVEHFARILKDYDRLQLGYKAMELIDKLTEDDAGEEYFELLKLTFEQLDDLQLTLPMVEVWLRLQLLRLLGQQPNVLEEQGGGELDPVGRYDFDPGEGTFVQREQGRYSADHIKAWRLLMLRAPSALKHVRGLPTAADESVDSLRGLFAQLFQGTT